MLYGGSLQMATLQICGDFWTVWKQLSSGIGLGVVLAGQMKRGCGTCVWHVRHNTLLLSLTFRPVKEAC